MVDSGISSSDFGQADVGTEAASRGRLGDNQTLEFEVVEARFGTLAGEGELTKGDFAYIISSFICLEFRNSLPFFFFF